MEESKVRLLFASLLMLYWSLAGERFTIIFLPKDNYSRQVLLLLLCKALEIVPTFLISMILCVCGVIVGERSQNKKLVNIGIVIIPWMALFFVVISATLVLFVDNFFLFFGAMVCYLIALYLLSSGTISLFKEL